MSEENDMLRAVKLRKIRKYGHWKRRGDSIILAKIDGETTGWEIREIRGAGD